MPVLLLVGLTGLYVSRLGGEELTLTGVSLADSVPMEWGKWTGHDLTLTELELAELQPEGYLLRSYDDSESAARPATVLILYWGASSAKPHAPEVCLTSQDYSVFDERQVTLMEGGARQVVNHFRARKGMTERVIYYWWYTGEGATGDFGSFKKETALRGVLGQPSWGAFVRVQSAGLREEAPQLEETCRDLSERLLRILPGVFTIS